MSLLSETLLKEAAELFSKGVRLHVIGEVEKLPTLVREQLLNVVELTKENSKGNLVLALSYGSQREILNAVKEIAQEVKEGKIVGIKIEKGKNYKISYKVNINEMFASEVILNAIR